MEDLAKIVRDRAAALLPKQERVELQEPYVRQCLDANERGDGVLYANLNRGQFLYNTTTLDGEWMVWNENVWERDDFKYSFAAVEECAIEYANCALDLAREIKAESITKKSEQSWKIAVKEKYEKRVDRLRTAAGASKVLTWAPIVDRSMACKESDFDKSPWLLPVANGVLDLRTGVLVDGRPEDLLTRRINVAYDKEAEYQPWIDFVREVSGSDEVAAFIKRTFGYAITGNSHEQYIWVFTGPGRNGKGILFNLISEVMGPYYHPISRAMLLEQRNEPSPNAASEHLYSLLGKRIIVGAETNKGQKIDASAVKGLTGDDEITCRPLFKNEIKFYPTHTLFLHTNHIPLGLTRDFAMIQRLLKIEFPNMYVDDVDAERKKSPGQAERFRKKDPLLKDKLRQCKPGILRWLVEGCLEWQQDGLAPPQVIIDGVDALARAEDYIGQFIEQCLLHFPGESDTRLSCKIMYAAFKWWWKQNMDDRDNRVPSMKAINSAMRDLGYIIEQKSGRYWAYHMTLNPDITTALAEDGSD